MKFPVRRITRYRQSPSLAHFPTPGVGQEGGELADREVVGRRQGVDRGEPAGQQKPRCTTYGGGNLVRTPGHGKCWQIAGQTPLPKNAPSPNCKLHLPKLWPPWGISSFGSQIQSPPPLYEEGMVTKKNNQITSLMKYPLRGPEFQPNEIPGGGTLFGRVVE